MKRLAWKLVSEHGHLVKVWLVHGEPRGVLHLTLLNGVTWRTNIGVHEIALFATHHDYIHRNLLEPYLDEMTLNAEASLTPRIQ